VARYEFWRSPTDLIAWHLAALPELGSEIVLGDRGVFQVLGPRKSFDQKATAYDVAFVRKATLDESRAAGIALNDFLMSGGWD
jgi:hypothetical protein